MGRGSQGATETLPSNAVGNRFADALAIVRGMDGWSRSPKQQLEALSTELYGGAIQKHEERVSRENQAGSLAEASLAADMAANSSNVTRPTPMLYSLGNVTRDNSPGLTTQAELPTSESIKVTVGVPSSFQNIALSGNASRFKSPSNGIVSLNIAPNVTTKNKEFGTRKNALWEFCISWVATKLLLDFG